MTKETRFKIKVIAFLVALLLLALVGFSQKDTLYSNNICYYQQTVHVGDVENKTQILNGKDSVSFVNLNNDSVFAIVKQNLIGYQKFNDGETAVKYSSSLKGKTVNFGLLYNKNKIIVSVSITDDNGDGFIFAVVPKEEVLPTNKNLK